jgi:hypothetical protein
MKILKVPISSVVPWDKNPRGIKTEDFERLKKQILKLGVYKPLVCYRNGKKYVVLGGNMRIRALQELGVQEVEISLVMPKTEAERIEYALSDNDRAGYYEEDKLAELVFPYMAQLNLDEFRVDIGRSVDLKSLLDQFGPDDEMKRGELADTNGAFSVDQIVDLTAKEILELDTKDIEKRIMSLALIAFQFNRLCAGKRDGYWISIYHNAHRLYCTAKNHRNALTILESRNKKFATALAKFIVFYSGQVVLPPQTIKFTRTGQAGSIIVNEFPPYVARDLVLEYTKGKNRIAVLDPCHGWGGRLIGALAAMKRVRYVGVDPAERTNKGLRNLADFLLSAKKIKALGSSVELICDGFETAKIPRGPYDFAITSPPYFDLERYDDGEKQVWKKYATAEEFNAGFLRTLIQKTMASLRPEVAFVLNVSSDKYDMGKNVEKICGELKLSCRVLEGNRIGGVGLGDRASSDEYEFGEPFFEIRRA